MWAAENSSCDPQKKLSHDIKKLSCGSSKVCSRSLHSQGRFYERGKGLAEELKGQIIDKILETGGDRLSGYFPAKWIELGDKFGVSEKTVKNTWKKFVHHCTMKLRTQSR